ncbi:unnamed protein product [Microthlaspi erraticum]|uniref:Exocyst subunit Exo70 family protein n=1 Tax=Microthlaspi erraticum TaxID=1685480 RepID=A0A6D2HQW2_9BRAS|nr:unnamed protein product [Microthlaspi erraticum]
MAATTTTAASVSAAGAGGAGAEDRVLATAQQIVKSLNNAPKDVRDDMLLIFSSFDNRLSNIKTVMTDQNDALLARLEAAETVIHRWDGGNDSSRHSSSSSSNHHRCSSFSLSLDESPEEATEFLSAVDEIISLLEDLSSENKPDLVDRADSALQMAMSQLEDEFRRILIRNTVPLDAERLYGSMRRVSLSFADGDVVEDFENFGLVADGEGSGNGSRRRLFHERGGSIGCDLWVDLINPTAVEDLREIAERMIRAGYEKECVQVYSTVRREALDECLAILDVEKLSIEEVQKIDWRSMDEKMKKWIQAVKIAVRVLLAGEKKLCDEIFSGSESSREVCFNETTKSCVMQMLNFGEAVAIGKRSPEKLFRILDMYDALANVVQCLELMVTDEFVCNEARGVLEALGDAARGTFVEFESNVRDETSKKPTTNGEVHPMIRYVMNYMKLIVDYAATLESLLEKDEEADGDSSTLTEEMSKSALAKRMLRLITSLESNLEEKSKLYEDGGLQNVFLMNNIYYVVQKVKDSELGKLLGDDWVRKRRGQIRQYATGYLRASWSKVLSALRDENMGGSSSGSPSYGQRSSGSSSSASKVALKERFRGFNASFEELYRLQTAWKVPDPQLREELRISISEKVIPAYRAFFGRNKSQIEGGRHAGKYIKYTPDDLESYLPDLFEGNQLVIHPRRKSS